MKTQQIAILLACLLHSSHTELIRDPPATALLKGSTFHVLPTEVRDHQGHWSMQTRVLPA